MSIVNEVSIYNKLDLIIKELQKFNKKFSQPEFIKLTGTSNETYWIRKSSILGLSEGFVSKNNTVVWVGPGPDDYFEVKETDTEILAKLEER